VKFHVTCSEGGLGKPVGGDSGTAPQSDPYTEHATREGKLYCAVVLDTFSRRVVGWSIDSRQETSLVTNALGMALTNREPDENTVVHSDQGTQHTSWAFTERVIDAGLLASIGSVGDCLFTGYSRWKEGDESLGKSEDLAA
jgi:putative transposase